MDIKQCIIHASATFLTEPLPDNYEDMENLEEWVEQHATELYEYYDGVCLLEDIEESAEHWHRVITREMSNVHR
jgi:hypothetical protein